ncbi:hypothetical protein CVT26_010595 [Gymnopilus dilepis]|uniref:DUF6533 domain-containing protein n=1 Tax=Gymnopilus dilepis TaxID=231916 RepID=A0A409VZE7_9AGAR|nr:hypothetical protein CVT26_010595 [Gymnopilus dilepis]
MLLATLQPSLVLLFPVSSRRSGSPSFICAMYDDLDVETQQFIYNCTLWAAFVILYYDYLLTLKTEIKWYWCSIDNQPRRFSLARVLFFLNRYVSIIGNIPVILPFFAPRFDSHRLEYHQCLIIAVQLIVAIIAILRSYAIHASNRRLVAVLSPVVIALSLYGVYEVLTEKVSRYSLSDLPRYGCQLPITVEMLALTSVATSQADSMTSRAPGFARAWVVHLGFDFLVLLATLYSALKYKHESRLIPLIIRDGTMYFGVIAVSVVFVIVSYPFFPAYLRGGTATLTSVLSSTMMSRLFFNLRSHDDDQIQTKSVLSELIFQLGSHPSSSADDEDDAGVDGDESRWDNTHEKPPDNAV